MQGPSWDDHWHLLHAGAHTPQPMQTQRGIQNMRQSNTDDKKHPLRHSERGEILTDGVQHYFAAERMLHFCMICATLNKGSGAEARQSIQRQLSRRKATLPGPLQLPAGRLSLIFQACHACMTSKRAGAGLAGKHICWDLFAAPLASLHYYAKFKKFKTLPDPLAFSIPTRHRHQTSQ